MASVGKQVQRLADGRTRAAPPDLASLCFGARCRALRYDVARTHFCPRCNDNADALYEALRAGKLKLPPPRHWPEPRLPRNLAYRNVFRPNHQND